MIFGSGFAAWADTLCDGGRIGADGPYLFYNEDGSVRMAGIGRNGNVLDTVFVSGLPEGFSVRVEGQSGKYAFDVPVVRKSRPEWNYRQARRTFILSDPHGKMDIVVELLMRNGVVDSGLNWSFGRNHLVVIGDVFDRGEDVTQILWLLYKLETEAEKAGGRLSFLLGNHEPMVLAGDLRYTEKKYPDVAETLGLEVPELYGSNTELGRWLATRNTIEKAGSNIFVHAGLGPEMPGLGLRIPEINAAVSSGLFKDRAQRYADPLLKALLTNPGPVWYRGLVLDEERYNPIEPSELEAVLEYFDADRMFVGHTVMDDITILWDGRVIAVNVDLEENLRSGRGMAVMLSRGRLRVVR
ncbi:MAG: metallophosphoesterase [Candidatus Cryptobacteroides sp.]